MFLHIHQKFSMLRGLLNKDQILSYFPIYITFVSNFFEVAYVLVH